MSAPGPSLEEWSRTAHWTEARLRQEARDAEDDARIRSFEAGKSAPQDLGLEPCPHCGWWRDPVPQPALTSEEAFRTYLAMARARCMCTTARCHRCHEPLLADRPVPWYFAPAWGRLQWSGGWVAGLAHEVRCRGAPT
jgi:hypothetical protein